MSDEIERRAFIKGAAVGAVTITVGGVDAFLDARAAFAQGAPSKVFTPAEARTVEALGETLVPGARSAGRRPLRRIGSCRGRQGGAARSAHSQRQASLRELLSGGHRRHRRHASGQCGDPR